MATETITDEKRVIQRSAAYPALTIQDAISFIANIKKSFQTAPFKREDIIAVLKRTTINRDIAAAAHYGLVDRQGADGYKLSANVQAILNSVSEEEKWSAILDCFKAPKLYVELIEKFQGHPLPPDSQLRAILIRFHGITEAAAPQACEVFIENARFAGALDDNRILLGEGSTAEKRPDQIAVEGHKGGSDGHDEEHSNIATFVEKSSGSSDGKAPLLIEEINGSVNQKIFLSEKKFAYLIYPTKLNEKDIQILKLQLEALALTL